MVTNKYIPPTLLTVMLCVVSVVILPAQTPSSFADYKPRFEIFRIPSGEGSNAVNCVIQDKVGFVWFGSHNGLHRYDGQHFKTYLHDPLDSNSIISSYVQWIFQDSKGLFWVGSWRDGLSLFDPKTERTVRYTNDPKNSNSLSNNRVMHIVEDGTGFIWVTTANGLNRFDRKTSKFTRFFHDPNDPKSLSHNFIRTLYVDKSGTLWAGCGSPYDEQDVEGHLGGLNRYNPEGTFTRFLHDPKNPNSLRDNRVGALFEDSQHQFWVGTSAGLHLMNRETGTFTHLPFDATHPSRLGSPVLQKLKLVTLEDYHITFISEDQKGRLWVGSVKGGLNIYDPESKMMKHFEGAKDKVDSLQTHTVWTFCQTQEGVIWLTCASYGGLVYRVKNDINLFPFYSTNQMGIEKTILTGVLKDTNGYIWLQTVGEPADVVRFNRKNNELKRFSYEPSVNSHVFLDLDELRTDSYNNLWASTAKGLYKINLKQTQANDNIFRLDTTLSKKIKTDSVGTPYFDRKGNVWIATWGDGLYRFDPHKKAYTHFRHDPNDPLSIGGNQVDKIIEDKQGNLLVSGGGILIDPKNPLFLDRFDYENNTFTHLLPSGEMGDLCAIVEDKSGNIWFSPFPYGIRKLNPKTGELKSFTVNNGRLLLDRIIDMVMGSDSNIWMLSKDYIIRLNPETESFYYFSAPHGVKTATFIYISGTYQSFDGEIFFSSDGGFHAFYPAEVHRLARKNPPQVRITGLKVFDAFVLPEKGDVLKHPIWETKEIHLPHNQNVFSLYVSAFDFNAPELTYLEYKLENYDRTWRNDLRKGEVAYLNVPPGKYIFRVRGTNSLGEWSKEDTTLRIVVLPPWWQTWWAYLLYVVIIGGSIFTIYRFQLNRRLEHAEALRLQEMDAVKTKLYTNITHEFRTPLTVILGMAQQVLEKPKEHFQEGLNMIIRNGQNLLNLVNQMLDLSKLESGKLTLHYQQGDVVTFLKYIAESFHSLAENKGVKIHFISDTENLFMDFDETRLQQVVANLLSNAIKFTPKDGHIYVSIATQNSKLSIKIKDTGIGIAETNLPHIFDRFYQVDDTHTRYGEGTGIGLALIHELVKLMGGIIVVKSYLNEGSEFEVTLPIQHLSDITIAEGEERLLQRVNDIKNPILPTENENPAIAPMDSDEEKPLVLIADDNADVRAYLISCLSTDYHLIIAKDGQECEIIAFETTPDLIVLDVMMPFKDGFEVCKTLKSDERTSHIPIIMLTAKADLESKLEGLERGVDAYLMKPFHKEELLLRIKKLLELRQQLQQHYLSIAEFTDGTSRSNIPKQSGDYREGDNNHSEEMPLKTNSLLVNNLENAFVIKVRKTVETHLTDYSFDIEKLCRALALSHSQVHRKLSALTGLSATNFMRYVRLLKSKELLLNSGFSITAVAYDSGFNDPAYFSRVFKQEFGVSPQAWREQHTPSV